MATGILMMKNGKTLHVDANEDISGIIIFDK